MQPRCTSNQFDVMNIAHEKYNPLEGNDKLHHVMSWVFFFVQVNQQISPDHPY